MGQVEVVWQICITAKADDYSFIVNMCKEISRSTGSRIHCSPTSSGQSIVWTQSLPMVSDRYVKRTVMDVAKMFAKKHGVRLSNPRLFRPSEYQ